MTAGFVELGAPELQAEEAAVRVDAFSLLDIVEVSEAAGCSVEKAAEVYFALSERLHVDMLLTRISALDRSDRWNALARSALRFDLYNVLARITRAVVSPTAWRCRHGWSGDRPVGDCECRRAGARRGHRC